MRPLSCSLLLLLCCVSRLSVGGSVGPKGGLNEAQLSELRVAAHGRGVVIGAAVDLRIILSASREKAQLAKEGAPKSPSDPSRALRYDALVGDQLAAISFPRWFTWDQVERSRGREEFGYLDAGAEFAAAHQQQVLGGPLLTDTALPPWICESANELGWCEHTDLLGEAMSLLVQAHVNHVCQRLRNVSVVPWWVVVADALVESPAAGAQLPDYLKRNVHFSLLGGPYYIDQVFRWAHRAAPNGRLLLGQSGASTPGPKADALLNLLKGMMDRGVPVHGVALGMQLDAADAAGPRRVPSQEELRQHLVSFSSLGLDVYLVDVSVASSPAPADSEHASVRDPQTAAYGSIVRACLDVAACKAVFLGAVADDEEAVSTLEGVDLTPNVFSDVLARKPAGDELADAFLHYTSPFRGSHDYHMSPYLIIVLSLLGIPVVMWLFKCTVAAYVAADINRSNWDEDRHGVAGDDDEDQDGEAVPILGSASAERHR